VGMNMIKKIRDWIYKKWMKTDMAHKKRRDLVVFRILETYLTQRIIEGQQERRAELGDMQKRIEEIEKFLEFLKTI